MDELCFKSLSGLRQMQIRSNNGTNKWYKNNTKEAPFMP